MQNGFDRINKIYNWLEDETSKKIYMNRINYVQTEDYQYIRNIVNTSWPQLVAESKKDVEDFLNTLAADREFIVYGAGEDALANIKYYADDKRFLGFCDKDIVKQNKGLEGLKVYSPDEVFTRFRDKYIAISSNDYYQDIEKNLLAHGYNKEDFCKLLRFGCAHDPNQYFSPDFITYTDSEILIDAGCFNLYTVDTFSRYSKNIKKVYSFEPNEADYKTCLEKSKKYDFNIELYNYGLWNESGTLGFNNDPRGMSYIDESCEYKIKVVRLDDIVSDQDKITFIKMDIEGAELAALEGACNTIAKFKPKLAICIYHKAEDLWLIPEYIKEINPDYKLYIRHHSNRAAETVLYAI